LNNKKKALILGITGQDGFYLTNFLHNKGYQIIGTSRNINKKKAILSHKNYLRNDIEIINLNPLDNYQIFKIINKFRPNEIYNLCGHTSVNFSFQQPVDTIHSIVEVTLNILESIRKIDCNIRFYNAGSSECFGNMAKFSANESTPFCPISPYGVAKTCSSNLVSCYRDAYNLKCCTGILFNHESPLRSPKFVTQKIISAAYQISLGSKQKLELGMINIIRDWGWAPDYVEAMYLMLQKKNMEDYVIGTGKSVSLKCFVSKVFKYFNLEWEKHVKINKALFRPNEIMVSKSDPSHAKKNLGWSAKLDIDKIISHMCKNIGQKL